MGFAGQQVGQLVACAVAAFHIVRLKQLHTAAVLGHRVAHTGKGVGILAGHLCHLGGQGCKLLLGVESQGAGLVSGVEGTTERARLGTGRLTGAHVERTDWATDPAGHPNLGMDVEVVEVVIGVKLGHCRPHAILVQVGQGTHGVRLQRVAIRPQPAVLLVDVGAVDGATQDVGHRLGKLAHRLVELASGEHIHILGQRIQPLLARRHYLPLVDKPMGDVAALAVAGEHLVDGARVHMTVDGAGHHLSNVGQRPLIIAIFAQGGQVTAQCIAQGLECVIARAGHHGSRALVHAS